MPNLPKSESEFLLAKAEQCSRLAKHVRGDLPRPEAAAELDILANELMARAVEIDTSRDRAETLKHRRLHHAAGIRSAGGSSTR
jgi:hypothetical protein